MPSSTYRWRTRGGERESERRGGSGEGSFPFSPRMWAVCLDKNRTEPDSEIAPFYCTSVYFESVSLAFLHLTWWLHHFPQGTEYISESGRSTGFLSARKQQLVREGLHLTTDLRSYLVWVYLKVPNKTFRLCTGKGNYCNYNIEASYSNGGSFFHVGFSVNVERIKASAHFHHSRFVIYELSVKDLFLKSILPIKRETNSSKSMSNKGSVFFPFIYIYVTNWSCGVSDIWAFSGQGIFNNTVGLHYRNCRISGLGAWVEVKPELPGSIPEVRKPSFKIPLMFLTTNNYKYILWTELFSTSALHIMCCVLSWSWSYCV